MNEQEREDVLTVWEYIRVNGGMLHTNSVFLTTDGATGILFREGTHGRDWLHQAAKWIRQQKQ